MKRMESMVVSGGGGGATQPLPRNGGVKELHGNPAVVQRANVSQFSRGAQPSGRSQSSGISIICRSLCWLDRFQTIDNL